MRPTELGSLRRATKMGLRVIVFLTTLMLGSHAIAQTAQELLDNAFKVHLAQTSFFGTASMRQVSVTLVRQEGQSLGESRYDITSQQCEHISARIRPPDDWAVKLDSQTVSGRAPGRVALSSEIATKIDGVAQSGMLVGQAGNLTLKNTSLQQFNERLQFIFGGGTHYNNTPPDIFYRYLLPGTRGLSNISWGLLGPEIKRVEEAPDGSKIYCVAAKSIEGGPVLMWIDGADFHVIRSIQLKQGNINPGSIQPGYESLALNFVEATYTSEIDRKATDPDFAEFHEPAIDFSLPVNQARFLDIIDLVRIWADEIETASGQGTSAKRARDLALSQVPAAVPKPSQFLSATQMSSIIMVEGDKGRGSGFMTRIKNADFVVTNLHVIGANKAITLKTMTGATLPYTAIYGAIGRDIAILRIAKAEGDLNLAEDVMGTTKIGQNVVVVGNKAGGGVANETTGKVKGLGPDRIEIDAAFQSGNSGSPIVSSETGNVIGIATYIQTNSVDVAGWARSPNSGMINEELRWFGFRIDGPVQWQAINLSKWQIQGKRIDDLKAVSDALVSALRARFQDINEQPQLLALVKDFKNRTARLGSNASAYSDAVRDFSRQLRALAEDNMKDVKTANFYDYYQTCLYWGDNVQAQLSYREAIIRALKDSEENPLSFASRLRSQ